MNWVSVAAMIFCPRNSIGRGTTPRAAITLPFSTQTSEGTSGVAQGFLSSISQKYSASAAEGCRDCPRMARKYSVAVASANSSLKGRISVMAGGRLLQHAYCSIRYEGLVE